MGVVLAINGIEHFESGGTGVLEADILKHSGLEGFAGNDSVQAFSWGLARHDLL
jgi:hypothetical protein